MKPETWDNELTRCFGMLLDGRAQVTGIKRRGSDVTLLIVFNAHHDVVKFRLPRCYEAYHWNLQMDTNAPRLPAGKFRVGHVYQVTGRSLLLFERVATKSVPRKGKSSRLRPEAPSSSVEGHGSSRRISRR